MAEPSPALPLGLFGGRRGRKLRESLTAYLFLLPAMAIIFVFGLWPVVYSLYVSLHKWNITPKGSQCFSYWLAHIGLAAPQALEKTDCLGLDNYISLLGLQSPWSVIRLLAALALGWVAWRVWGQERQAQARSVWTYRIGWIALFVAAVGMLAWSIPGLIASGEWTYLVSIGLLLIAWPVWKSAVLAHSTMRSILRAAAACLLLSGAVVFILIDFNRMWELGNQTMIRSLIYTVFYSVGTVPVQLSISLVLAYILFRGINARGLFRLIYFLPYIAPTVATAVVFKRIFSLRETGLMNQMIGVVGIPPLRWLSEAKPIMPLLVDLINQKLGTQWVWPQIGGPIGVILGGPSLALISVMIYNWWVYIGYDTVIYMAGLGSIPHELYEAASIDGADGWTAFRRITIPLLSPTIFFLAVMATIGTFKAFNSVWVMYETASRGTVDTTSILIVRTFRGSGQFGLAAAMAFILFAIILALSEIQRKVGERMVFYG